MHPLVEGLESTMEEIRFFCRKGPDILRLVNEAATPIDKRGGEGFALRDSRPGCGGRRAGEGDAHRAGRACERAGEGCAAGGSLREAG